MDNQVPGLFEGADESVQLEQVVFDYRLLPADKREFVMQKTDETQILLKRTAEKVIQIGKNLLEVKAVLPHGTFLPWLQSEFSMSHVTANNFMQVAKRFETKLSTVDNLSVSVLYMLAAPGTTQEAIDETLYRAESGEKITKALAKQIIEAQEALKKAQEEEAQARADAILAQQQLFQTQTQSRSESERLQSQITALQEEMTSLTTPPVEYIKEEVWPEEKIKEVATLQEKIDTLNTLIETEKKTVPPEVQRQVDTLQSQLDKLKEERKQQEEVKKQQEERIAKLKDDIQSAIRNGEIADNADRIRQSWRLINSEAHTCLMRLLGQWPTPVDVQSFDADDWGRVDHLKSVLRRVLAECEDLQHDRSGVTIDMNPYAIVESE